MTLSLHDRRRILIASAITVAALPALWFANQPDSGAPNVATAGLAIAQSDTGDPAAEPRASEAAPVFLDGPTAPIGAGVAEIAVPVAPGSERLTTRATFRSNVVNVGACRMPGMGNAQRVTVVNLDNNRSVTCTTVLTPTGARDEVVMHPELFSQIADLTDAPIPVEIRR